mgnify:CR=1 FL=1
MFKPLLIGVWFLISIYVFTTATMIVILASSKKPFTASVSLVGITSANSAPAGENLGISANIQSNDARVAIVESFLARHNSPLTPHLHFAQFIVETADTYGVDYRLIPAIMMQESNLCKRIPPGSYNCLGFGIHSRGTLTFPTYEASIERATRELKSNYIDIGLVTPEQIMRKYTPGSTGSWASSVNQWIAEMEYNDRNKGRTLKEDADLLEYVDDTR